MNFSRRFEVQVTARVALIVGMLLLVFYLLFRTDLVITLVLLVAVSAILVVELALFVRRTNLDVAGFFENLRHAEFSHVMRPGLQGAGFDELATSMRDVVDRLQAMRRSGEEEQLRLRALVEHVPIPMFGLFADDRVVLHNHAARRFFGSPPVRSVDDLARFGPELVQAVRTQTPGQAALIRLETSETATQRMSLSLTELVVGQKRQRLMTLQNISDELAATELEAWQQMAQVLAHEIMNSLTPVASLADTARSLLVSKNVADHDKAHEAIKTVAQRADSLMTFVQGYRRFTRLPAPTRTQIDLGKLLRAIAEIPMTESDQPAISVEVVTTPAMIQLYADQAQLEQVLINLLRNAVVAVRVADSPQVQLRASLDRHGRIEIEVADNGPGVPAELRERVFVPYYSTRDEGSGIGLALTRQVMIAHGGTAELATSDLGGTAVRLRF